MWTTFRHDNVLLSTKPHFLFLPLLGDNLAFGINLIAAGFIEIYFV